LEKSGGKEREELIEKKYYGSVVAFTDVPAGATVRLAADKGVPRSMLPEFLPATICDGRGGGSGLTTVGGGVEPPGRTGRVAAWTC